MTTLSMAQGNQEYPKPLAKEKGLGQTYWKKKSGSRRVGIGYRIVEIFDQIFAGHSFTLGYFLEVLFYFWR